MVTLPGLVRTSLWRVTERTQVDLTARVVGPDPTRSPFTGVWGVCGVARFVVPASTGWIATLTKKKAHELATVKWGHELVLECEGRTLHVDLRGAIVTPREAEYTGWRFEGPLPPEYRALQSLLEPHAADVHLDELVFLVGTRVRVQGFAVPSVDPSASRGGPFRSADREPVADFTVVGEPHVVLDELVTD